MEWILVNDEGLLTSVQRAQIISRELYNITRPVFTQQAYEADLMLFEYIIHPEFKTQAALIVDTQRIIEVHPSCSLEKLIAVFPELTIDERFALSGVIHQTQAFPFGLILPNTVTVRDEAYMVANGWIIPDK
jgi:hypothetical protein